MGSCRMLPGMAKKTSRKMSIYENPIPKDSPGLAILAGAGVLLGAATLVAAVDTADAPHPAAGAAVGGAVAVGAGYGAMKLNDSHPRLSTALGMTALLSGLGAVLRVVNAMGQSGFHG